jgi:hypothetical protein
MVSESRRGPPGSAAQKPGRRGHAGSRWELQCDRDRLSFPVGHLPICKTRAWSNLTLKSLSVFLKGSSVSGIKVALRKAWNLFAKCSPSPRSRIAWGQPGLPCNAVGSMRDGPVGRHPAPPCGTTAGPFGPRGGPTAVTQGGAAARAAGDLTGVPSWAEPRRN